MGSEFAGTVDALGPGATGFAIGDRVCGSLSIGAWADQVCVPASALQHVAPQAAIDEAAVLLTPYGTALYALRERGRLQAGETVLVLGATGSIGDAGVQTAKALGARVIAAASSAVKREAITRLYAPDAVIAAEPGFRDEVKALTGGKGADVIFDPVGGDLFDESTRCIAFGGRLLVIGFASGRIPEVSVNMPLIKEVAGGKLVPEKLDNALGSLLFGEVAQLAAKSPFASLTVEADDKRLLAKATVAGKRQDLGESYAAFFPDEGEPGVRPLPASSTPCPRAES